MSLSLNYKEHLLPGVDLELEQIVSSYNAIFNEQHDGSDGSHTNITCTKITGKPATAKQIQIDGILQFLGGAWLLDEPGNATHAAGLRPIEIVANQNNYSPPGLSGAILLEVTSDANRSITGLDRSSKRQKRILIFGNIGAYNITLEHADAGSQSYNRFDLPGDVDVVLGPGEYVWLCYDTENEVWHTISYIG